MFLKKVCGIIIIFNIATIQAQDIPPNLIVIMTDDQGYSDVGFNGCIDIPTPNIDAIAENGVKFTRGYVSYPVCGPSRAGFLTVVTKVDLGSRTIRQSIQTTQLQVFQQMKKLLLKF